MSPYRTDGKLENLFPERFITQTGEEIADKVADRWRDRVAMRTPVARLPEAYKGNFEEWILDRGGRKPRTMRDGWTRTEIMHVGDDTLRVEIFNPDPKTIFVEQDTRPHLIRAKRAKALRYPIGPSFHYNVEVHHPGTQGRHMARDTEAEMEVMWIDIAEEVIGRKEQEYSDV